MAQGELEPEVLAELEQEEELAEMPEYQDGAATVDEDLDFLEDATEEEIAEYDASQTPTATVADALNNTNQTISNNPSTATIEVNADTNKEAATVSRDALSSNDTRSVQNPARMAAMAYANQIAAAATDGTHLTKVNASLADASSWLENISAAAAQSSTKERNDELRDNLSKYLTENGIESFPPFDNDDIWAQFKNGDIDAKTFLEKCEPPDEIAAYGIDFLRIILQSNALHHDAGMAVRGKFYNARKNLLDKVAEINAAPADPDNPTKLIDQKAIILNLPELRNLVNLHGQAAKGQEEGGNRLEQSTLHYHKELDKAQRAVIASYTGLGQGSDLQKLTTIQKHFRAVQYKTGLLNGYKNNENAALENFANLHGKQCGAAMIAGYRAVIAKSETIPEQKTREEAAVLAWEMEVEVMEKAFGAAPNSFKNASMIRQLPLEEKEAIKMMVRDIGKGALISGGVSLGLSVGVGVMSKIPATAPFAPLLAVGLTAYNVLNQVACAFQSVVERTQAQNGIDRQKVQHGPLRGVRQVVKDVSWFAKQDKKTRQQIFKSVDWGKVTLNTVISSTPVLLASIPMVGDAAVAAGIVPETAMTGIMQFLPKAATFLSLGMAAKGFVQTFAKARDAGISKVKSGLLAAVGAVSNILSSLAGSSVGESGVNAVADTVSGQGDGLIANTVEAFKHGSIAELAGKIAGKFGWGKSEQVVEPAQISTQSTEEPAQLTQRQQSIQDGEMQKISTQHQVTGNTPSKGQDVGGDAEMDDVADAGTSRTKVANEIEKHQIGSQLSSQMGQLYAAAELANKKTTRVSRHGSEHIVEGRDFYGNAEYEFNNEKIKEKAQTAIQKLKTEFTDDGDYIILTDIARQIKKNPNMFGAQYSLANILDMESNSPEFLSFYKLFGDHDWQFVQYTEALEADIKNDKEHDPSADTIKQAKALITEFIGRHQAQEQKQEQEQEQEQGQGREQEQEQKQEPQKNIGGIINALKNFGGRAVEAIVTETVKTHDEVAQLNLFGGSIDDLPPTAGNTEEEKLDTARQNIVKEFWRNNAPTAAAYPPAEAEASI